MLLKNKVVFLTGGSVGIGRECAFAYAREGETVAIVALEADAAAATAAELGSGHLGFACNVTQDAQVKAAIERVLETYGRIDVIHNNAGLGAPSKPLHETSDAEWDALFNTNVRSVLLTTRHGIEALTRSRGNILNTSSMVGVIGQADHAAYTATKGAMNTLTKSMALDYAPQGVRVNAVCPAGIWTPMLRRWAAEQKNAADIARYLDDIHPLGRCPEGDVIGDACVFLASDSARFITGHLMHVSGGAELGYRRVS